MKDESSPLMQRISELKAKNRETLDEIACALCVPFPELATKDEIIEHAEYLREELTAAEATLEAVAGLPEKLAAKLLALGDEHKSPAKRIQFMGGTWPDNERPQGGMNCDALTSFFTSELEALLK